MLWIFAIALFVVAVAAPGGPLLALGLLGGGYFLSIHLHPYTQCDACKGTGRHRGAVFTYAQRPCHKCSGARRKQRLSAARRN
jgi:hypothetical protein